MKMIARIVFVSVLAESATPALLAATSPATGTADTIEWTASNAERLKAMFPNAAAVAALDRRTAPSDHDADSDNIGDFRVVNLNNDGNLQVVCLVDVTGRAWYTEVIIFSQHSGKIVRSIISTGGANIGSLDRRLVELHHDGQKQLLLPRWLGPYKGAQPLATFTDVYRFDGQRALRVNQEFSDYYRKTELPRLHSELDALTKSAGAGESAVEAARQKQMAAIQQEIDEIHNTIQ
jgi:hypothetical protein